MFKRRWEDFFVSIFGRRRSYYPQPTPHWQRAAASLTGPVRTLPQRSASRTTFVSPTGQGLSVAAARESVREQASRSRAEIKALVEAERTEMKALVADSVKTMEEHLRGVTENRIDLELARIREAEEKLQAEMAESIRAEVGKTIAKLRGPTGSPLPKKRAAAAKKAATARKKSAVKRAAKNGSGKVKNPA